MKICVSLLLICFVLHGLLLKRSEAQRQISRILKNLEGVKRRTEISSRHSTEVVDFESIDDAIVETTYLSDYNYENMNVDFSNSSDRRTDIWSLPRLGRHLRPMGLSFQQRQPINPNIPESDVREKRVSSSTVPFRDSGGQTESPSSSPSESFYPSTIMNYHPTGNMGPTTSPTSSAGPTGSLSSIPSESFYPSSISSDDPIPPVAPSVSSRIPIFFEVQTSEPTMLLAVSHTPIGRPSSLPSTSLYPNTVPSYHPTDSVDPSASPTSSGGPTGSPSSAPSESFHPTTNFSIISLDVPVSFEDPGGAPLSTTSSPTRPEELSVSPSESISEEFAPSDAPTDVSIDDLGPSASPKISIDFSLSPSYHFPNQRTSSMPSESSTSSDAPAKIEMLTSTPNFSSEPTLKQLDGFPTSASSISSYDFHTEYPSEKPLTETNAPIFTLRFEPTSGELPKNQLLQGPLYDQPDWTIGLIGTIIAIGSIALIAYIFYLYHKAYFQCSGNTNFDDGSHVCLNQQGEPSSHGDDSSFVFMMDGSSDDTFDTVDLNQGQFEEMSDGFEFVGV
jgi:hypothetical protein